jgi:hypothetical protein
MPADINSARKRRANENRQAEINVFDVSVAVMAAGWLVLYFILIAHGKTNQIFAAALELSATY